VPVSISATRRGRLDQRAAVDSFHANIRRVTDHDEGDAALVQRCLYGDAEAWRRLVDRHRAGMIDLARRFLPSAAAADVVDVVIADLWERRKLERYEGRSSLGTWLGAIVINAALNARRAALARRETTTPDGERHEPPAVTSFGDGETDLAQILHDAIGSLPASLKVLVLMYYDQGLTLDEVSALVGSSKSNLSRRLQKAREQILAEADRLARERLGASLECLRSGVDLGQLDLDLRAACTLERNRHERQVSKRRWAW
jgi:RNA polymerase sigma-70 factor, ECF subfamily